MPMVIPLPKTKLSFENLKIDGMSRELNMILMIILKINVNDILFLKISIQAEDIFGNTFFSCST
jgi:hypothetical protein